MAAGAARRACRTGHTPAEAQPPVVISRPLSRHLALLPPHLAAAGLGRAPATALAWMWWFKDWHLDEAYEHLTGAAHRCWWRRLLRRYKLLRLLLPLVVVVEVALLLFLPQQATVWPHHALLPLGHVMKPPPPPRAAPAPTPRRHPHLQAQGARDPGGGRGCAVRGAAHARPHHAATLRR